MQRVFLALALALGMCSPVRAAAETEPVLEVDLGPAQATGTPTLQPTSTLVPTAVPTPTQLVQAQPETVTAAVAVAPTAVPAADLNDVRFDKGGRGDEGLMIIAPGAASPEDSLESFGIDSPFNWKHRDRKALEPGKAAEDEALELTAPESSELRERVQVETGEGEALPSDSDYDLVERAGAVVSASEYRVDGRVARTKDGQIFARKGIQVALRMEPGRQVYPGSVYTVFREGGVLRSSGENAQDVGMLLRNVGVLRVIRLEGEEVLARIDKQYGTIREGDLVRLRDPERLKYYNSLRQGPSTAALDLKGEVVGMPPPAMVANRGDILYLDLGRAKGLVPGMRLMITSDPDLSGHEGMRPLRPTGRIGLLQVVSVTRDAASARVIQALGDIRYGDHVRYR